MYDSESPRFFGEDDMMKWFADEKNGKFNLQTKKHQKTGGLMIQIMAIDVELMLSTFENTALPIICKQRSKHLLLISLASDTYSHGSSTYCILYTTQNDTSLIHSPVKNEVLFWSFFAFLWRDLRQVPSRTSLAKYSLSMTRVNNWMGRIIIRLQEKNQTRIPRM